MAKRKNVLKSTSELTLKQKAFVDIYVSNWGEITKVEAARRAGYKSNKPEGPTEIASRLTDPKEPTCSQIHGNEVQPRIKKT